MTTVNNCNIPSELYYLVEKHVWGRLEDDLVTVGLTDVAQNLAKGMLSVLPKTVGRKVAKGKSVATVESAKWVGPVPALVSGEIVEINQAVLADPKIINADPYGEGWIAKMRPSDWDTEAADLHTGDEGVEAYRAFLDSEGIICGDE